MSSRTAAFVAVALVAATLPTAGLAAPVTTRVSVSSTGTEADGWFGPPEISGDGRFVAFESSSSALAAGDSNDAVDVFVHDRAQASTERLSVSASGAQADSDSSRPRLSSDGRFLSFTSNATNLVPGDTNDAGDVFVVDRHRGVVERVSVSANGTQSEEGGWFSDVSDDGRYIVFESSASDLVPGDTNGVSDVFIRDRVQRTTERVSVSHAGLQADSGSGNPRISADGRVVVFESWASNLVPGDTNDEGDVFVRDRANGSTERVSVSHAGAQADAESENPRISADGRVVAFESWATNLVPGDSNAVGDVFVRDRDHETTERVSVGTGGAQGHFGWASSPSVSADGRYVAFASHAPDLIPDDDNQAADVLVHDRATGTTEAVSVAADGSVGSWSSEDWSSGSDDPAITDDGRFVGFTSSAMDLVAGDVNGLRDVFVRGPLPGDPLPAPHGPSWVGPQRFAPEAVNCVADGGCGASVSVAPGGLVLAASEDRSWQLGDTHGTAYAALRAPGGDWERVDVTGLVARDLGTAGTGYDLVRDAAVTDSGDASVLVRRHDSVGTLAEAYRYPGGDWKARALPVPGDASVATGTEGATAAAWSIASGTAASGATVRLVARDGIDGAWADATDLAFPDGPVPPSQTIEGIGTTASGGDLAVAFVRRRVAGDTLWVAMHQASGGWTTPVRISGPENGARLRLIALESSRNGHLAVAWSLSRDDGPIPVRVAVLEPGTVDWRTLLVVTDLKGGTYPAVDVGNDGGIVVAWPELVPSPGAEPHAACVVRVGEGHDARDWTLTTVAELTSYDESFQDVDDLNVEIDDTGGAAVAWHWTDGYAESTGTQEIARLQGGRWSVPLDFGWSGGAPAIGSDDQGDHVFAFGQGNVLVRDPAGPRLRMSGPGAALAGAPVGFTVEAFDTWSGTAGQPDWIFGDGAGSSGWSTIHTFTQVGLFRVSASHEDGLGNRSEAGATVRIESPPAPPSESPVTQAAQPVGQATSSPAPARRTTGARALPRMLSSAAVARAAGSIGVRTVTVGPLRARIPKSLQTGTGKRLLITYSTSATGRLTATLLRKGRTVKRTTASLGSSGAFVTTVRTPKNPAAGAYRLRLSFDPDHGPVASRSVPLRIFSNR